MPSVKLTQKLAGADRPQLITLLVIAATLRLIAIGYWRDDLADDRDAYLGIAQGIADGRGFSVPGSDQPTAFRPPLYPLLIAPISQATPAHNIARGLLNLALGLGTVFLVWRSAARLGLGTLGKTLAGLIIAIDPLLVRYTPFPMTETFCTFLAALYLWMLADSKWSWQNGIKIGVTFGVLVLCRPTFWAFGVVAAVISFCIHTHRRMTIPVDFSKRLGHSIATLLATGLVVTPWFVRNELALGDPVLMTTHGGYTLLLGNNEAFYAEVVNQPFGTIWDGSHGPGQAGWINGLEVEMTELELEGEIKRDRWMSQRAKETILQHPETFARACLKKFLWFWNIAPHAPAAGGVPGIAIVGLAIYYIILWGLLLVGMGLVIGKSIRKPGEMRSWWWPLLFVLCLSGVHLVYWSDARMRAPAMPAIALLCAAAVIFTRKSSAESAGFD